jgi:hypothetical protein
MAPFVSELKSESAFPELTGIKQLRLQMPEMQPCTFTGLAGYWK